MRTVSAFVFRYAQEIQRALTMELDLFAETATLTLRVAVCRNSHVAAQLTESDDAELKRGRGK